MNEYVSVIIPTYNRERLLKRSIESVINQTYRNWELIIVDDCSTDNTKFLVESYMKEESRIRYVCMDKNGGAAKARNYGVTQAKYDLIAFQDSDDEWKENKLQEQMELLSDKVGLCYCDYLYHGEDGQKLGVCPSEDIAEILKSGFMLPQLLVMNMIGTPTMLIKKSCFNAVGGFNEDLKCLEDYEFILRFSKRYKIAHVNEVLVNAYATPGSVGSNLQHYFNAKLYIYNSFYEDAKENDVLDVLEETLIEKAKQFGIAEQVLTIIENIKKTRGENF